jgi:hypothetical protein
MTAVVSRMYCYASERRQLALFVNVYLLYAGLIFYIRC